MKNSLSSLPPAFVMSWYRNQPDVVKDNFRRAIGIFDSSKVNSSKSNVSQANPRS